MRSISRVAGRVDQHRDQAADRRWRACAAFHDDTVQQREVAKRVQCDEIWSFCYAKEKNVAAAKAAPGDAGDVWTWTAIDADTKLIVSYVVGRPRCRRGDRCSWTTWPTALANRVQLTTDGHTAYLGAVEGAFGDGRGLRHAGQDLRRRPDEPARPLQPAECIGAKQDADRWAHPIRSTSQHVLRRAPEPHDAHGQCAASPA